MGDRAVKVSISLCEGVEWVTELEEAAMSVSISLCVIPVEEWSG